MVFEKLRDGRTDERDSLGLFSANSQENKKLPNSNERIVKKYEKPPFLDIWGQNGLKIAILGTFWSLAISRLRPKDSRLSVRSFVRLFVRIAISQNLHIRIF